MNYALLVLPVVVLILSASLVIRAVKHGKKAKTALVPQLAAFMIVCAVIIAVPMVVSAATDDSTNAATTSVTDDGTNAGKEGLSPPAAGLVTGLAGISDGIAVGTTSPVVIGATTEDPKSFGRSPIFIALGEGIALHGLLTSILILNKI